MHYATENYDPISFLCQEHYTMDISRRMFFSPFVCSVDRPKEPRRLLNSKFYGEETIMGEEEGLCRGLIFFIIFLEEIIAKMVPQ